MPEEVSLCPASCFPWVANCRVASRRAPTRVRGRRCAALVLQHVCPLMLRFLPLIVRADVAVSFSYRMERPVPVGFRMHGIELRVFTRVLVSIAVMVVAVNWHIAVLCSRGRCPQRVDGLCGGQ